MDTEDLRLAVYRAFAETGRSPGADELAGELGVEIPVVAAGLEELARARHLVLGDQSQIVMAHPFSAVPLGFSVLGARTPVVGRLRLGFLRAAASASRRGRGARGDQVPGVRAAAGLERGFAASA